MAGATVCIWHRARLVGESLAHLVSARQSLQCQWIDSSSVLNAAWLDTSCELLVLDATAAHSETAEVVLQMRRQCPPCKLLLLVPDNATERLVALMQLGSQGCIREDSSLEELCTAIEVVRAGASYFSPELANALFAQLNGSDQQSSWGPYVDTQRLTPREREILRLIASENLSNKQIARRLHLSLYTVKNHVHNIIEKMDVNDRHGAAQLAQRRHLIPACAAV
jgi:DNA-binding NarL/FixJ family response regulator